MFSFDIDCWQDEKDVLIADLFELGSSGINEMDGFVRAFFDDEAVRPVLRARFPEAREAAADDRDWVEYSRRQWQPRAVGKRFFLVPDWLDTPAPEGRIRIAINAGQAFGTGAHESTRLCLELLEDYLEPGHHVADVGTGSGILAEAAVRLGAADVVACDVDPVSVEVAAEALLAAGIEIRMFTGSAGDLPASSFDLVTANISPEVLAVIALDLKKALKSGGRLILSGIEEPDLPVLTAALAAGGLQIVETRAESNWRALVVTGSGSV